MLAILGVQLDREEEFREHMRGRLSWLQILGDVFRLLALCLRPKTSLAAENLFPRKQLADGSDRHAQKIDRALG
jgi:hypothetical protein